jgi:hypothetical protein
MAGNNSGPRKPAGQLDSKKLDDVVANAHKQRDMRKAGPSSRSSSIPGSADAVGAPSRART